MGGQHIERQARYEQSGVTTAERDRIIAALHNRGYSQRQIAKHLGITQPAVHYRLLHLAGKERNRARYDMCDSCGENVEKTELNADGLCPECVSEDR